MNVAAQTMAGQDASVAGALGEFQDDDALVNAICQVLADHFRLHERVRHGELVIKLKDGQYNFSTLNRFVKPQVILPA